jgi:6-phosphogluconolactonase (cycloisomerase 2 family)
MQANVLVKSARCALIGGVLLAMGTVLTAGAAPGDASNVLAYIETECDNCPDLTGATAAAVSPDGKHVYVASWGADTVAVFKRDTTSGRLTFVQQVTDGDPGGVFGLDGVNSVAVSPDGENVYVTGRGDNAVVAFARSSTTGGLTYLAQYLDGAASDWLGEPTSVAVSPDGEDVYVGSCGDDAVVHFERNPSTGLLSNANPYIFLDCIASVAVTDSNLYAVGSKSSNIAAFSRGTDGSLSHLETETDEAGGVDGMQGPVDVTAVGDRVYVASATESAVAVFDVESDGSLTFLAAAENGSGGVSNLLEARAVAVSSDGLHHIYGASFGDGAVVTLQYLTYPSPVLFFKGYVKDGVDGVDGLHGASGMAISPDDRHVYVASEFDGVAVFERDSVTGALTFVERRREVDGLDGAQSVAVSPDGDHVYVASYYDDAVAIFSRGGAGGAVDYVGRVRDGLSGVDGLNGANSVAVSPDDGNVYVTGIDDDAIAVFDRQSPTGTLELLEVHQNGATGGDYLSSPSSVAVSPVGGYVYVTSVVSDSLTIFLRNPVSGTLSFYAAKRDGVNDVDGLDGAEAVAASPDGKHVYVAGYHESSLAVFEWGLGNPIPVPVLRYVTVYKDGVSGIAALGNAQSVAVSPDGMHVYVAAFSDSAVQVFGRDNDTGELEDLGEVRDGVGGVDGIAGASSLAISPDGAYVFVTGSAENELGIFGRNSQTGALTFLGIEADSDASVAGLADPQSVAVSPDGRNVYVAAYDYDLSSGAGALTVFGHFRIYLPLVLRNY